MTIQRRIDTRSTPADKDLIEEEVVHIHRGFVGNQLPPFRAMIGMNRNYWGAGAGGTYSSYVIITNTTDVDLAVPWVRSDDSGWEDLDSDPMVIGAPDFVHYEQVHKIMNTGSIDMPDALAFVLAPSDISGPAAHTSLYSILDAWIEDRIQARVQDERKEITEYYEEQLAIKESEISELSNELSQVKKEDLQHNYESEQIANQYKEAIVKIPEVQQIVYTQYEKNIEFIVVVDSIERDLFYHLSQIESQLCDQYPDWIFEFETISPQTFSQQYRDGYTNLFSRD